MIRLIRHRLSKTLVKMKEMVSSTYNFCNHFCLDKHNALPYDKYEHVSKNYSSADNQKLNEKVLENHRLVMQKPHKGGKRG